LESVYTGNRIKGSNPFLSANALFVIVRLPTSQIPRYDAAIVSCLPSPAFNPVCLNPAEICGYIR
jgi:hypothetical protein